LRIPKHTILTILLLLGVAVETLSAVEWAVYPYFPDKSLFFARIDATIFGILSPFSPTFLILLLYIWPLRLTMSLDNRLSRQFKSTINRFTQPLLRTRPKTTPTPEPRLALTNHPRLLLLLAMSAGVLLGFIPYRSDLNPAMIPIGVDAHFYIDAVNQMIQRTPTSAIYYVMGNPWASSRPLLLIPMYLTAATGFVSVNQSVEALPAILGPLLALSTFIFVREGCQNQRTAAIASLFSAISFNTTVGMWAGFYANWLALAEANLFLAALLAFLRTSSRSMLIIMTLLSVCILLTHPWTWLVALAVAIVFVATFRRDQGRSIVERPLALLVVINIIVDLAISLVFGGTVATQDASASLSESGISQTLNFWPNIIVGIFSAYSGLLANALFLGLPMLSMLLLRFRDKFERLLTLWVVIGSLPFPFLSSLLQTRILYDLPIPAMMPVGLLFLIRPVRNSATHSNLSVLLVLLLGANYALRTVTNLVAPPL